MHLHKYQMGNDYNRRYRRQNRDMKTKEASQCSSGNIVPAAKKPEHRPADQRNNSRDLGPNLGGKEREFVPRKEISAEPKANRQKQKEHAAQPGQLARRAICPHEINAEHVNEESRDHKVGRPAVY